MTLTFRQAKQRYYAQYIGAGCNPDTAAIAATAQARQLVSGVTPNARQQAAISQCIANLNRN